MKKRTKYRHEAPKLGADVILPIIQARAEEHGSLKGHTFTVWRNAKKAFGKHAFRTFCNVCGRYVVAAPYGDGRSVQPWVREHPGIMGDALTQPCLQEPEPEQKPLPMGVLGLRHI